MNEAILTFLKSVCGEGRVALRGVGEKGTDKFGRFSEPVMVASALEAGPHLARWTEHGIGAFVVPAEIDPACDRSAPHDEDVARFHCLLVDLDDEALAPKALHFLTEVIGPPSFVVASSGMSSGKRHLYWLLDEPCEDTRMIAATRRAIAELVGGDVAFFRIPQIIRVPGTINHKNGGRLDVLLVENRPTLSYSLDDALAAIGEAERPQWAPEPKRAKRAIVDENGLLAFSETTAADMTSAPVVLTQEVTEGGGPDANRWSEFSRVAGHYVRALRHGDLETVEEAHDLTYGWMLAQMKPAWPADRFEKEWHAILARDITTKGPMVRASPILSQRLVGPDGQSAEAAVPAVVPSPDTTPRSTNALAAWATDRWTMGNKPQRRWLVDGLIAARKSHFLAAEGGAGKTFSVLDLGMKLAAPRFGETWLGQKISDPTRGGTVVILTAEDDKDELHARLSDMDPDGSRRREAGDRFIVIPLLDAGGAIHLVKRDTKNGEAEATDRYEQTLACLKQIPDLLLVGIDTLASTMHGDENAAIIAQEWAYAAARICGECGAAYVATHHMRKSDRTRRKDAPPRTIDDVKDDIRGSNALLSAARMNIVIYQPDDWEERLKALGEKPERGMLWRMGVAKANNPEAMKGERTLLRTKIGTLEDVTTREIQGAVADTDAKRLAAEQRDAWLVWEIARAAERGEPYTHTGPWGFFERRDLMPEPLRELLRAEGATGKTFSEKKRSPVHALLDAGQVVSTTIRARDLTGKLRPQPCLDVPGGRVHIAAGMLDRAEGAPTRSNAELCSYDTDRKCIVYSA
jgi:hypothetical protein